MKTADITFEAKARHTFVNIIRNTEDNLEKLTKDQAVFKLMVIRAMAQDILDENPPYVVLTKNA